jgi:hypothetical protein
MTPSSGHTLLEKGSRQIAARRIESRPTKFALYASGRSDSEPGERVFCSILPSVCVTNSSLMSPFCH